MINPEKVELFLLKCAVVEGAVKSALAPYDDARFFPDDITRDESLEPFIRQFEAENRLNAARMARYYQIFYMLENDIRGLIADTLEAAHKANWWDTCVPQPVKDEVAKNRDREAKAGVSTRSDSDLDYTTFGQLGDIIRDNWSDFAGMLSNQSAVSRVFAALNMLRGTIAHCGMLADDEVDRLKLAIRDWFRVLEGPKA
jgi:hypothetical protein